ncbi:359d42d9-4473-40b4-90b3-502ba9a9147d [Sclerotinia trifoliorum]|uniref:359d42d9-4473-40b4-90b3-502ba9a9147d n=1 Tax=Sclerotinia trifoliorum TaxID=28548 RepID=A0A8H2VWV6_9HELO|nr:359d42d9-4473-40b4-90b3-502ba9a9147d [Sclerotinia trifoliorum]
MGVFGPLETTNRTIPIIASPQEAPNNNEDPEIARKHQLEEESNSIPNGPPGKKPRLTNGYENGISNGTSNGMSNGNGNGNGSVNYYESASTPMEIDGDQNGDGHAYPSPEQLPSPITATNGPEKGTQYDKVSNLKTETIYLDLLDDNASKSTILYRCEWNPRIPHFLAAGGTDSLARMWDLSRTVTDQSNGSNTLSNASDMNGNGSFPPCTHLLEPLAPQTTVVNELTWSSDGNHILVASEQSEGTANVAVWSVKGQLLHTSAPMESPVISVRWNFSNTLFLSISPITVTPNAIGTAVTITSMMDFRTIQYTLPSVPLLEYPLEALWMSDEDFIVYGANSWRYFELLMELLNMVSKLLATGSESGMIDIWDEHGRSRTFNAHTGPITSLVWQPLPSNMVNENGERLLASSSEDGAISIWNAISSEPKQKCSMTIDSTSIFTVKFTSDGAFIAGATSDRVFIWKVDDTYIPRATWNRPPGNGWQTPQSNESNGEDEYVLSWDANGQKLAYGVVVCWQSSTSVDDSVARSSWKQK